MFAIVVGGIEPAALVDYRYRVEQSMRLALAFWTRRDRIGIKPLSAFELVATDRASVVIEWHEFLLLKRLVSNPHLGLLTRFDQCSITGLPCQH